MQDLVISLSVNGFPVLTSKCATLKPVHITPTFFSPAFVKMFSCDDEAQLIAFHSSARSLPECFLYSFSCLLSYCHRMLYSFTSQLEFQSHLAIHRAIQQIYARGSLIADMPAPCISGSTHCIYKYLT